VIDDRAMKTLMAEVAKAKHPKRKKAKKGKAKK
jgi:hypothetical protein